MFRCRMLDIHPYVIALVRGAGPFHIQDYSSAQELLSAHKAWQGATLQQLKGETIGQQNSRLPGVVLVSTPDSGWGNRLPSVVTGEPGDKGLTTRPATCHTHRGSHVAGRSCRFCYSKYKFQAKQTRTPGQLHQKNLRLEMYAVACSWL